MSPLPKEKVKSNEQIDKMQRWMLDALVQPGSVNQNDVVNRLTPSANLQAAECLAIYQRGYILRLTKCLAEQFPALCHALGKQLFDQFACEYLKDCPSDSYTLYELGRRFPDYLESTRPDRDLPAEQRESWIDFMVDLAQYERLHFKLFDAPGHEGNPWPDNQQPDQNLILQPCLALAVHRYPVAWYYHAIKEKPDVAFPPLQTSHVVVLRKDYLVTTYPISQIHYLFLQQLQASGSIDQALKHISDVANTPIEQVSRSWREEVRGRWINAGFFVARTPKLPK